MWGFQPIKTVSFYQRSKDAAGFVRKGVIFLPKVEGCGSFCPKGRHPSTAGRRMRGCAERRELEEPGVEELDGMDGVDAGAVEDLLAAGGTRSDDDGRSGGNRSG